MIFFKILMALIFTNMASTAYGFFLSGLFNSIRMTLELAPPIDLILYVLGGIYINVRQFPYIKYISVFYYANEAILIEYWKDVPEIGE